MLIAGLQRIVNGVSTRADLGRISQIRIGSAAGDSARAWERLVDIGRSHDVDAGLPDISHGENVVPRQLPLHVQVPFVRGWILVSAWIVSESRAGYGKQIWAAGGESS